MLRTLFFSLFLIVATPQSHAESFDLGLGYSFIQAVHGDGFTGGWDLQLGYEFGRYEGWNIGGEIQATGGWTNKSYFTETSDLEFSSNAVYLTARPYDGWLYFKGGIVDTDFQTLNDSQHTVGAGFGAGIVFKAAGMRFHMLDYQRLIIGDQSFNVYTISITLLNGVFEYK